MAKVLIANAKIFTPSAPAFNGWLLTDDKKICSFHRGNPSEEIKSAADKTIDAGGMSLIPGFIDLHTHGCLGHCAMDADPEAVLRMAERHVKHGVTAFLPTTMTDSKDRTVKAIQAISSLVGKRGNHAKIAGVYLEGPYFNADKCGAQDPGSIRRADRSEIAAFLDAGLVKVIAMAPEFDENCLAGDIFAARGITVSAGHTNAKYADLLRAVDHGYTQITHLYNGMGAFGHREPGTIGGALTIADYYTELICDNIHSHPAGQKLAWMAKGNKKIILITDSIRPAGLADGTYSYNQNRDTFIVSKNGSDLRIPNGSLAGSALTMDRALKNFTENAGATLEETWRCSSLNAAISIGISHETGSIEAGKLADLVLLDDAYQAQWTMVEGSIV